MVIEVSCIYIGFIKLLCIFLVCLDGSIFYMYIEIIEILCFIFFNKRKLFFCSGCLIVLFIIVFKKWYLSIYIKKFLDNFSLVNIIFK